MAWKHYGLTIATQICVGGGGTKQNSIYQKITIKRPSTRGCHTYIFLNENTRVDAKETADSIVESLGPKPVILLYRMIDLLPLNSVRGHTRAGARKRKSADGCQSQLVPSAFPVLGTELQSPGLCGKNFHSLSHLSFDLLIILFYSRLAF